MYTYSPLNFNNSINQTLSPEKYYNYNNLCNFTFFIISYIFAILQSFLKEIYYGRRSYKKT